jgi:hypothetical protein
MSELCVLRSQVGVNGEGRKRPERKPWLAGCKPMRHARRLAAVAGAVGVGVLDCP